MAGFCEKLLWRAKGSGQTVDLEGPSPLSTKPIHPEVQEVMDVQQKAV